MKINPVTGLPLADTTTQPLVGSANDFTGVRDFSTLKENNIPIFGSSESLEAQLANSQGYFEKLGKQALNTQVNVIAGIGETIGLLGEGVGYAVDWAQGDLRREQLDFTNWLTEASESIKNPIDVYWRKQEEGVLNKFNPFDNFIEDAEFWMQNGLGLYESIASFAATGLGVGTALRGTVGLGTKLAARGLVNAFNAGKLARGTVMAGDILSTVGTSASLAYAEGAMSAAQIFKDTYDAFVLEEGHEKALRRAGESAALTAKVNTAIGTALNLTSTAALFSNPRAILKKEINKRIFSKGIDKIDDIVADAAKRQFGRAAKAKAVAGEAFQESLEELGNVVAERRGRQNAGLINEESFIESIERALKSDEGQISMILGALGGAGNTLITPMAKRLASRVGTIIKDPTNIGPKLTAKDQQLAELKSYATAYVNKVKTLMDSNQEAMAHIDSVVNEMNGPNPNRTIEEAFREIDTSINTLMENNMVWALENQTVPELKQYYQSLAQITDKTLAELDPSAVTALEQEFEQLANLPQEQRTPQVEQRAKEIQSELNRLQSTTQKQAMGVPETFDLSDLQNMSKDGLERIETIANLWDTSYSIDDFMKRREKLHIEENLQAIEEEIDEEIEEQLEEYKRTVEDKEDAKELVKEKEKTLQKEKKETIEEVEKKLEAQAQERKEKLQKQKEEELKKKEDEAKAKEAENRSKAEEIKEGDLEQLADEMNGVNEETGLPVPEKSSVTLNEETGQLEDNTNEQQTEESEQPKKESVQESSSTPQTQEQVVNKEAEQEILDNLEHVALSRKGVYRRALEATGEPTFATQAANTSSHLKAGVPLSHEVVRSNQKLNLYHDGKVSEITVEELLANYPEDVIIDHLPIKTLTGDRYNGPYEFVGWIPATNVSKDPATRDKIRKLREYLINYEKAELEIKSVGYGAQSGDVFIHTDQNGNQVFKDTSEVLRSTPQVVHEARPAVITGYGRETKVVLSPSKYKRTLINRSQTIREYTGRVGTIIPINEKEEMFVSLVQKKYKDLGQPNFATALAMFFHTWATGEQMVLGETPIDNNEMASFIRSFLNAPYGFLEYASQLESENEDMKTSDVARQAILEYLNGYDLTVEEAGEVRTRGAEIVKGVRKTIPSFFFYKGFLYFNVPKKANEEVTLKDIRFISRPKKGEQLSAKAQAILTENIKLLRNAIDESYVNISERLISDESDELMRFQNFFQWANDVGIELDTTFGGKVDTYNPYFYATKTSIRAVSDPKKPDSTTYMYGRTIEVGPRREIPQEVGPTSNVTQKEDVNEQEVVSVPKLTEQDKKDAEYVMSDEELDEDFNDPQYQKGYINESLKETEFGIRDLAARLAHRIGGEVEFESDLTKDYSGYNQGKKSVINLARATLDTPIHEILGHPIIRAIRDKIELDVEKFDTDQGEEYIVTERVSKLYQNLLKELETGYGKEVLDRVKRDYNKKPGIPIQNRNTILYEGIRINGIKTSTFHNPTFHNVTFNFNSKGYYITRNGSIMEITPEGAVNVENITPELKEKAQEVFKIAQDLVKNGLPQGNYTLEEQQEEALVQLLGELTAGKIKESKENKNLNGLLRQLLKEITAYVRSLFNSKEIEIDKLSADMTLNDLANLLAYTNSKIILPGSRVEYTTPDNQRFATYQEASNHVSKLFNENKDVDLSNVRLNIAKTIEDVPKRNFTYFQPSDPFGIAHHEIEVLHNPYNKKGWFMVHPYEGELYPLKDDTVVKYYNNHSIVGFIEKNKEYEQSKKIIETWKKENNIVYNPEEVYSRGQGFYSAIGAYSTVELDLLLQNLLQHIEDNKKAGGSFDISAFTAPIGKKLKHLGESQVRFTIFPKSEDIKWAAPTDVYSGSVWDAAEKVSKDKKSELIGVTYTKAPLLRNINEVSPNLADIIDKRSHSHNELSIELTNTNFRLEYDKSVPYEIKKLVDSVNSILDQKYGKLVKPEIVKGDDYAQQIEGLMNDLQYYDAFKNEEPSALKGYNETLIKIKELQNKAPGIQPTQTRENTTRIESVKNKVVFNGDYFIVDLNGTFAVQNYEGEYENVFDNKEDAQNLLNKLNGNVKEYTSQALINTKIAKLKKVAKKYPRSLITSRVINNTQNERQYQKVKLTKQEERAAKYVISKEELEEGERLDEFETFYNVSQAGPSTKETSFRSIANIGTSSITNDIQLLKIEEAMTNEVLKEISLTLTTQEARERDTGRDIINKVFTSQRNTSLTELRKVNTPEKREIRIDSIKKQYLKKFPNRTDVQATRYAEKFVQRQVEQFSVIANLTKDDQDYLKLSVLDNLISMEILTVKIKEGEDIDVRSWDDTSSITADLSKGATVQLKAFLASIRAYNEKGKLYRNVIGKYDLVGYKKAYDIIKRILANSPNSWTDILDENGKVFQLGMRSRLKKYAKSKATREHAGQLYFLNEVIDRLEDGSAGISINQFTHNMHSHLVKMRTLIPGFNSVGVPTYELLDALDEAYRRRARNMLKTQISRSEHIDVGPAGSLVFRHDQMKERLFNEEDGIFTLMKKGEVDQEQLGNWMKEFGLTLTPNLWVEFQEVSSFFHITSKAERSKTAKDYNYDPFTNFLLRLYDETGADVLVQEVFHNPDKARQFRELTSAIIDGTPYELMYSSTSRQAGKDVASNSVSKSTFDELNRIHVPQYREKLKQLPFVRDALYLKERDGEILFDLEYASLEGYATSEVLPKGGQEVRKLGPKYLEIARVLRFVTSVTQPTKTKMARMFFPTMSDKQMNYVIVAPKEDMKFLNTDDGWDIAESTITTMINHVIKPEFDLLESGDAMMMYISPYLNDIVFAKEAGIATLRRWDDIEHLVRARIKEFLRQEIDAKLEEWKEFEVGKYLPEDYPVSNYELVSDSKENYALNIIGDYVLNSILATTNSYQLFTGHPRFFHKSKHPVNVVEREQLDKSLAKNKRLRRTLQYHYTLEDYYEEVEDTMNNMGKRLAANNAPRQAFNLSEQPLHKKYGISPTDYRVTVSKSYEEGSSERILNKLEKIWEREYGKDVAKMYRKSYEGHDRTDAQEFITEEEFVYNSWMEGKISDEQFDSIYGKLRRGETIDWKREGLRPNAQKPVYTGFVWREGKRVPMFIKSAALVLTKEYTANTELETLRKWMVKNNISRHIFDSAYKVGAPKLSKNDTEGNEYFDGHLFRDGNLIPENELDLLASVDLSRENFGIQVQNPVKDKTQTVFGSQTKKILFQNIRNEIIGGKKGSEWEKEFMQNYSDLIEYEMEELLEEISPDGRTVSREAISNILQQEALSRKYPPSYIKALELDELGRYSLPIHLSPSFSALQSVIISIVNNRMNKLKMSGFSGALVSQEGRKIKASSTAPPGIVWVGEQIEELDYATDTNKAQVIIPWPFKGIPIWALYDEIEEIVTDEDGSETTIKRRKLKDSVSKELLIAMGYRIPSQAHASMASMEVVGFLPPEHANTIVAPAEFIAQMGSDFDIDKLYVYIKNNTIENKEEFFKQLNLYRELKKDIDKSISEKFDALDDEELMKEALDYQVSFFKRNYDVTVSVSESELEGLIEDLIGMTTDKELMNDLRAATYSSKKGDYDIFRDENNNYDRFVLSTLKMFSSIKGKRIAEILDSDDKKTQDFLKEAIKEQKLSVKVIVDNSNAKKVAQNNIIDIFNEVLSSDNPVLRAMNHAPLEYGGLYHLDSDINDSLPVQKLLNIRKAQRPRLWSPATDRYQRRKYTQAQSSKDSIGTFSSFVVLNAQAQQVTASGKDMIVYKLTKKGPIPREIRIGRYKSLKAFKENGLKIDGKIKKISEVALAFQSVAVDDEKLQVLGALNVNEHTYGFINTLIAYGFNEEFIASVLLQDSIIEYVNQLNLKDADSGTDIVYKTLSKVLGESKEDIQDHIKQHIKSDLAILDAFNMPDLSMKDMQEVIKVGKDHPLYKDVQIHMVSIFTRSDHEDINRKILQMAGVMGLDSKGPGSTSGQIMALSDSIYNQLGKPQDLSKNYARAISVNSDPSSIVISGSEDFISNSTVPGVHANSISLISNMFGKELNLNTNVITPKLISDLQMNTEGMNRAEVYDEVVKAQRQIIYGTHFLGLTNPLIKTSAYEERRRLLTPYQGHVSFAELVTIVNKELNNIFLAHLSPVYDQLSNTYTLEFNSAYTDFSVNKQIQQAFYDLYNNERPLGQYFGKNYTTKDLAFDLASYAFLIGDGSNSYEFMKHIPVEFLQDIGFAEYLHNASDVLDDANLAEAITSQLSLTFYANNVYNLRVYDPTSEINPPVTRQPIKIPAIPRRYKGQFINSNITTNVIRIEPEGAPPLLLPQYGGKRYKEPITVEGVLGGQMQITPPIGSQNFGLSVLNGMERLSTTFRIGSIATEQLVPQATDFTLDGQIFQNAGTIVKDRITSQLDEGLTKFFNTLIPEDTELKIIDRPGFYGSVKGKSLSLSPLIMFEDHAAYAMMSPSNFGIEAHKLQELADKYAEGDVKKFRQRVIIEELAHLVTIPQIKEIRENGTEEQKKALNAIDRFRNSFLKDKPYKDFVKKGRPFDHELAPIFYALESTEEFVGNFFASEDFRNFLDSKKYDSSKSFLDRFVELIKNLLKSLGLSKQNEKIMEDILGLMMEEQKSTLDIADPGWNLSLEDSALNISKVDQLLPRTKGQFQYQEMTFNSITHAIAGMKAATILYSNPNPSEEQSILVGKILRSTDPGEVKRLLGQVQGDRSQWNAERYSITLAIIRAKYEQVPEFRDMLNKTSTRELLYNNSEYAQMLMIVRNEQEFKERLREIGTIVNDQMLQVGSFIRHGEGEGIVVETGDTFTKLLGGITIPTSNIEVLGRYNHIITDKMYFFINGRIIGEDMTEVVEEIGEYIEAFETNNTFFNSTNSILEQIDRC